ncbi:hypothetical protein FACS1894184_13390 [Clostridia bacterium]|nr:hypothetical protein FACS1894184_13390 [Clostridia bacterium]
MDKLSVVVVDDEAAARVMLRALDWEGFGYRLAGEATDAESALALIERVRPDLALVDVVMPGRSGLELSRELRLSFPDMLVVLLSMYRDFDYVSEGLQLGVAGYLLKGSLGASSFFEKLNQIAKNHNKRRSLLDEEQRTRQTLTAFLRGENVDIQPMPFPSYALLLRINWKREPSALMKYSVEANAIGGVHARVFSALLAGDDCLLLLNSPPSRSLMSALCMDLERRYSGLVLVSAALCGVADSPAKLRDAVNAGISALANRFYTPDEHVFEHQFFSGDFSHEQRLTLLETLRKIQTSGESVMSLMDSINALCVKEHVAPESVKNVMITWQSELERRAVHANLEAKKSIFNAATLADMLRAADAFLSSARLDQIIGGRLEVGRAFQYIKDHLAEELSVELLASRFHFSQNHFGAVFKKQMGEGVRECVNRLRMERAAELLLNTNLKVYEIAERVGIPSVRYFQQVFMKHYKITPSEFRDR